MIYDLNNIAPQNVDNAGGVCSFEFLPKEQLLDEVALSIQDNKVLFPLSVAIPWFTALAANQTTGFIETPKRTESGLMYEQKVKFIIHKDTMPTNSLLYAMSFKEFVVIYKDRNGHRKIIGNRNKGMILTAELNIGTAFIDRNHFAVELYHESDRPSAFYPF